MLVFSPVKIELLFVLLESDAVHVQPANHHLIALHIVVHHVFQDGIQCFPVQNIKVDQFFSRNLEAGILLHMVNVATKTDCMIQVPMIFFFFIN